MTSEKEPLAMCHDCLVEPGQRHMPGCDVEQCPSCGRQLISCDCLADPEKASWIEKNLLPWTGRWPGKEEAAELGFWSKWVPNERFEADVKRVGLKEALAGLGGEPPGRWVVSGKEDPEAGPDLNRLHQEAVWDRERKRFVKRGA